MELKISYWVSERLEFGDLPNRGCLTRSDVSLNGVSYMQKVNNIPKPSTGRANRKQIGIHFEPGIASPGDNEIFHGNLRHFCEWHGNTINAQGLDSTVKDTFQGKRCPR